MIFSKMVAERHGHAVERQLEVMERNAVLLKL